MAENGNIINLPTREQLEELNEKLDKILSGEAPANVQLTSNKMKIYGADIADRPNANTVPKGATFTIVDNNLDQSWISNGTKWVEV